jgi:hypothetical protein
MKEPLENAWNGLVHRRLLPVAILLIAALVAIPFLLAKKPEPVSAPTGAPNAENGATAGSPADAAVVSLVNGEEAPQRRRVLGAAKNPFEPGPAPEAAATPTPVGGSGPVTGGTPADTGDGKPGGGSAPSGPVSVPGAPVAPVSPVSPTPTEPRPTYELYSLTVRFGESSSDTLERMNLPRLKALPSADEPVLVYLGPGEGGKTAIFMIDEGVDAQGDAECKPSPSNCETIHMRAGDTEFLDVIDEDGNVDAQYQLDLLKIKTSSTADAAKAAKARVAASKSGRSVLRARQAAVGPLRYRYDAKSGTVRKIGKRAFKALQAKTARAALGTAGGF